MKEGILNVEGLMKMEILLGNTINGKKWKVKISGKPEREKINKEKTK